MDIAGASDCDVDNQSLKPETREYLDDKAIQTTGSNEQDDLPDELRNVDFSKRISWRQAYELTEEGRLPHFTPESPALCHHVNAVCSTSRARACTIHLPHGPVETPVFMPVGTKGSLKGLTFHEVYEEPALQNQIILANTYHMELQPTTALLKQMGGLHKFMNWKSNLLTDSGGFQMVSLLKLAEITEEGVTFESPFQPGQRNLLKPEDSIQHQLNIGSDIMMALDDVVSSVADDDARFRLATHRTLRWLDRCLAVHTNRTTQNLFAIVQGGLDTTLGGLREQCLAGFQRRDSDIPGYAIGGLAGGESKDQFWRVVNQCCRSLPADKPRYCMGVGYAVDLVVCTALGVDMYDCVYPTRTARFGVALVDSGTVKLKSHECGKDANVIDTNCACQACRHGISRSRIHDWLKANNTMAAQLLTQHNLVYMRRLTKEMRDAIIEDRYPEFCRTFLNKQHPDGNIPEWVRDALGEFNIQV